MELCFQEEESFLGLLVWEEGGRRFRLLCCSNGTGRFIQYLVFLVEMKRFGLVFPEGMGCPGGGALLQISCVALGWSLPPRV